MCVPNIDLFSSASWVISSDYVPVKKYFSKAGGGGKEGGREGGKEGGREGRKDYKTSSAWCTAAPSVP